jgi:DNA-binding response OmpR family regulator
MASVPLVALVGARQSDRLELLEAGADDIWVDPVDSRELQVRLTGMYRRLHRSRPARVVRYGGVELDLDRYTVRFSGPPVKLTVKQVQVLQLLMENAGVVVSRTQLLENGWHNAELDGAVVRTFIKRLRQVLVVTGADDVIRSASGGYVFETEPAPVHPAHASAGTRPH